MVYLLTAFASTSAWAVDEGDSVALADINIAIKGNGVSLDEFMKSLTDTNGILRSCRFTDAKSEAGHDVIFDQSKMKVEGNHISVPFDYKDFGHNYSDGGGTLSSKDYTCSGDYACTDPAKNCGRELDLVTDPAKGPKDQIHIKQVVFQICAKMGPNGEVLAHIHSYVIAGPHYKGQALDAAKVIFSHVGNFMQEHAIAYASPNGTAAPAVAMAARSPSSIPPPVQIAASDLALNTRTPTGIILAETFHVAPPAGATSAK